MFKANKKQRKFVLDILGELRQKMYLQNWIVDIHFKDGPSVNNAVVVAETDTNSKYFEASISIFPCFFEQPVEEQYRVLIHEMCHIPLDIYKEMWETMHHGNIVTKHEEANINERATSMVSRFASDAYLEDLKKIVK